MGYDSMRFVNEVDEELKCPICCCVLKDALQAPDCEHTFCNDCINEWLLIQSNCPVDRQPLNKADLKPAPRVLRNFLAKLDIKCDFASFGCPAVVKLESLTSHCNECDFNPDKPVICEKGCGLVLLRNQVEEHNCLSDLRELVSNQQKQINDLKNSKRIQEELLGDLKLNLKRLQDQDINEQQRHIHNLQLQVNKLQQHIEILQKQQQYLAQQQQRSQSPIEVEDDCDCDTCDPTPRSCLYVSGSSRKRSSSWKDTPLAKRSPSVGKSYPLDSPSSVLDADHLRHNYYHHSQQHHHQHPSLSPLSPIESTRESQIHQQLITFYGTIITVNVSDDETIESLKTKMELKEGIKCDQQLLFFAGQQLEDDKTLCFYNITSDSSRHL
ncbi:E3 ubiquitin-protein ligase NRDP1-like protein, partial [Leptotrombidium deliense]